MKKHTADNHKALTTNPIPSPTNIDMRSADAQQLYLSQWNCMCEWACKAIDSPDIANQVVCHQLKRFFLKLILTGHHNPHVGNYLLDVLFDLMRHFALWCRNPSEWLQERAAHEVSMPCLLVAGKVDPKYLEISSRLSWGNMRIRRGKHRLDSFATRHVVEAMETVMEIRTFQDSRDRKRIQSLWGAVKDVNPKWGKQYMALIQADNLPDLTYETRHIWWKEVINPWIRAEVTLPVKYIAEIKQSIGCKESKADKGQTSSKKPIDGLTDSAVMNEHIKRCRKTFFSLIPKTQNPTP